MNWLQEIWFCFAYVIDFHLTVPVVTFNLRKVELTPLEQRKLTFDSHTMVTELESCGERIEHGLYWRDDSENNECGWLVFFLLSGFAKSQAELIVSALVTLTTANMDIVYKDMVTKAHQVFLISEAEPFFHL